MIELLSAFESPEMIFRAFNFIALFSKQLWNWGLDITFKYEKNFRSKHPFLFRQKKKSFLPIAPMEKQ